MAPFTFGVVCISGGLYSKILCQDILCIFYIHHGTQLWESHTYSITSFNWPWLFEHLLCMSTYGYIFVIGRCLDDVAQCVSFVFVSFLFLSLLKDAICTLNTLQTNASALEQVRRERAHPQIQLQAMRNFLQRSGLTVLCTQHTP